MSGEALANVIFAEVVEPLVWEKSIAVARYSLIQSPEA
jgi:hypothetical protein